MFLLLKLNGRITNFEMHLNATGHSITEFFKKENVARATGEHSVRQSQRRAD